MKITTEGGPRQPPSPGPAGLDRANEATAREEAYPDLARRLLEEPGSTIHTSASNSPANHIAGEEALMQMVVLPLDEDGAGDD